MTTTHTASPGPLDLARLEALARAADEGEGQHIYTNPCDSNGWQANEAWHRAASPAAVLSLIALARRAQPEGEAPQAEPVARVIAGEWGKKVAFLANGKDAPKVGTLLYTESGKETAQLSIGFANNDQGVHVSVMQRHPDDAITLLHQTKVPAGDSVAHFSIAVKQAAVPRTDLSKRIRAAATAEVTLAQAKLLIGAAEEIERAQQAAAPGALTLLNVDELAALHRFQETCQDFDSGGYDVDKGMMKRLAAIGVIECKGFSRYQFTEFGDYVVENRAPGTPEAPADDRKGIEMWRATLRACGELPEGYEVRIELENGCGMAVWYDAEGERHVIDGEGYLSDDVNEAVDLAIQHAAAPKGGVA